jgi:hypothetical protein
MDVIRVSHGNGSDVESVGDGCIVGGGCVVCNNDYGCSSGGDLVVTTPTVSTVVILVAVAKELK